MTEAAGGGSSSSSAPRRTPVIRLHGAPTLSPRQAPKKGGRRASEFYFREPEYLAPPRATVSTPPPGRKSKGDPVQSLLLNGHYFFANADPESGQVSSLEQSFPAR
ncbi:hypothetical protein IscW_ISCW011702 [Ixodes scapularis]|uniref:Uncharacterized protein n=1 Tax=Ixodes scapularis TaxID=6945 RepID=B7Q4Z0_IXOSC|nr:hypothetical protein IscW_ISCW011702 [Ixodes scapularis]|eukprot:XP_002411648.1 hypothetical protein IscW_ISCW011702 [Ixodes scapularis]